MGGGDKVSFVSHQQKKNGGGDMSPVSHPNKAHGFNSLYFIHFHSGVVRKFSRGRRNVPGGTRIMKFKVFGLKKAFHIERRLRKGILFQC